MWDLVTGVCLITLRGHSAAVLAVQAQGSRLISGSGDKTVRVSGQGIMGMLIFLIMLIVSSDENCNSLNQDVDI